MTKIFDYELVNNYITTLIHNGLKEDEKIPSENSLCEKFKLSRTTVRQGINQLKLEGLIYSKQGSGNYVSPKKINYTISPYTCFTKEIQKAKKKPSMKFLDVKVVQANGTIAQKLNINKSDDVLYVKNVRYVDDIPFLYAEYYMNLSQLKDIHLHIEQSNSISKLYMDTYNIQPIRDNSEIEILPLDESSKNIFNVQNNIPIIKISTSTTDKNTQQAIDYCYSYFRSDRAKILVDYKHGANND